MWKSFGLILTVAGLMINSAYAQPADQSANILKQQLEEERARARELEQQRKRLENAIDQRKRSVDKYDRVLEVYEYNLRDAQAAIEKAEAEAARIEKQLDRLELQFYRCVHTCETAMSAAPPVQRIRNEMLQQAAVKVSQELFQDIQEKRKRLKGQQYRVRERQAYQERILKKYMPVDQQKKEEQAQVLAQAQVEAAAKIAETEQAQKNVQKLQQELEAAEQKIAELLKQRLLEEKRKKEAEQQARAEQERKAQEQADAERKTKLAQMQAEFPNKISVSDLPAAQPTPIPVLKTAASTGATQPPAAAPAPPASSSSSFAQAKGRLPLPAAGKVEHPFGEYRHPEYNIVIKNPGVDIRVPVGTAVQAVAEGEVFFIGEIPSLGNTIILSHGDGYMTLYSPVAPVSGLFKNQTVRGGQTVGTVKEAMTYHFEIRHGEKALNPHEWLRSGL